MLEQILDILSQNHEAYSATALSKELGYSRKNADVCAILEELVAQGRVLCDNSGSYTEYFFNYDYTEKFVKNALDAGEIEAFDEDTVEVPEEAESRGYEIEEVSKGFKITLPSGRCYTLPKSQRILCINGEKHILLKTPEEVLYAIDYYATTNGYKNYLVKDLSVGRVAAPSDINKNPCVIFITIERHSKAG
jgi:Fe2+ or Zn2+ uptake regulation protein